MSKVSLSNLVGRFESETEKVESENRRIIFNRGNIREIEAYRTFIESMNNYLSDPKRSSQLLEVLLETNTVFAESKSVKEHEKSKETPVENKNWITYQMAKAYWKQRDIEAGRPPIKNHAYESRIKTLIKKGLLESRKKRNNLISVEETGFKKTVELYKSGHRKAHNIEGEVQRRQEPHAPREENWLSPREILDLYKKIERERLNIDNTQKSDIFYRSKVRYMIREGGLRTQGEGENLKISAAHLSELANKYFDKRSALKLKKKRVYDTFVRYVEVDGLSQDEALQKLGISGKKLGIYKTLYNKHKGKE